MNRINNDRTKIILPIFASYKNFYENSSTNRTRYVAAAFIFSWNNYNYHIRAIQGVGVSLSGNGTNYQCHGQQPDRVRESRAF